MKRPIKAWRPRTLSIRVNHINRIAFNIPIQIRIPTLKPYRILRRPPSGLRVVVSCTEADQPGVLVIDTSGKTKRLEAGISVGGDIAPHIIVDALSDAAVGNVDDQPGATQVVADDAVGVAVLDHVVRHIAF